jgi:hypothetical protein
MTAKALEKQSLSACAAAFKPLGFAKKRGVFLKEYTPDLFGWIGLNAAERNLPYSLLVNPVIGVVHSRLNAILDEIRDDIPKGPKPSVSTPLGYLTPRKSFAEWEFPSGGDLVSVAEMMAQSIEAYGFPYMEEFGDWEHFSSEAEKSGFLLENEASKVVPVIRAINGDHDGARRLVETELDKLSAREDMYAISYRAFSRRFFHHLPSI